MQLVACLTLAAGDLSVECGQKKLTKMEDNDMLNLLLGSAVKSGEVQNAKV